jgi:hypothetical protein
VKTPHKGVGKAPNEPVTSIPSDVVILQHQETDFGVLDSSFQTLKWKGYEGSQFYLRPENISEFTCVVIQVPLALPVRLGHFCP